MEIKLRIIEFSSDIFSNSLQLKDLIVIPLFSNSNFVINIYEAISKNKEYIFHSNRKILKLGLFNGKSLLGIGNLFTNKISQKVVFSEDNQVIKNDYFLTVECITNNIITEDKSNNFNLIKSEKRRHKSFENYKFKNNYQVLHTENNNSSIIKNIFSDKDIKSKRKNNISGHASEKKFKKVNNSFIIQRHTNIKKILFSNNNNNNNLNLSSSSKNQSCNIKVVNKSKISKEMRNININFPKIHMSNFNNLFNRINELYNKSIGKKILNKKNEIEYILEFKNILEKVNDIFNIYSKISNNIIEQNQNIKKFMKYYHKMIKINENS